MYRRVAVLFRSLCLGANPGLSAGVVARRAWAGFWGVRCWFSCPVQAHAFTSGTVKGFGAVALGLRLTSVQEQHSSPPLERQ